MNESAIRAKIQIVNEALITLEKEYERGYMDIGRYLRLKSEKEREKAELEAQLTGAAVGQTHSVAPEKQASRQKLYAVLQDNFDEEDLRNLCFLELGIEYDDLRGNGRLGKIRGLIAHCEHHGRIDELVKICQRLRPHVTW